MPDNNASGTGITGHALRLGAQPVAQVLPLRERLRVHRVEDLPGGIRMACAFGEQRGSVLHVVQGHQVAAPQEDEARAQASPQRMLELALASVDHAGPDDDHLRPISGGEIAHEPFLDVLRPRVRVSPEGLGLEWRGLVDERTGPHLVQAIHREGAHVHEAAGPADSPQDVEDVLRRENGRVEHLPPTADHGPRPDGTRHPTSPGGRPAPEDGRRRSVRTSATSSWARAGGSGVEGRTTAVTREPRRRNSVTRYRPRNPLAPVTSAFTAGCRPRRARARPR